MNRVTDLIGNLQDQIMSKNLSIEKQEQASRALDLTFAEHARFQTVKSLAQLASKFNLEESESVYAVLGPNPDFFNRQPLANKLAVGLLMGELMKESTKEKK